jgi:hypothetical protein
MGSSMAPGTTGHLQRFYRPVNAKYTLTLECGPALIEHHMGSARASSAGAYMRARCVQPAIQQLRSDSRSQCALFALDPES